MSMRLEERDESLSISSFGNFSNYVEPPNREQDSPAFSLADPQFNLKVSVLTQAGQLFYKIIITKDHKHQHLYPLKTDLDFVNLSRKLALNEVLERFWVIFEFGTPQQRCKLASAWLTQIRNKSLDQNHTEKSKVVLKILKIWLSLPYSRKQEKAFELSQFFLDKKLQWFKPSEHSDYTTLRNQMWDWLSSLAALDVSFCQLEDCFMLLTLFDEKNKSQPKIKRILNQNKYMRLLQLGMEFIGWNETVSFCLSIQNLHPAISNCSEGKRIMFMERMKEKADSLIENLKKMISPTKLQFYEVLNQLIN